MDARLLDYYNQELAYIREVGREFAHTYPKVAGRLGMVEGETADPYVERLLEGFAFLSARIHLKIDAEFPRFSQRLLEVLYPHYLAPTPSMCVVEIPYEGEPAGDIAQGLSLPRGTVLRSRPAGADGTRCDFVTGHDVVVWPIRLVDAVASSPTEDLMVPGVRNIAAAVSVIRLKFKAQTAGALKRCDLDSLCLFLGGEQRVASHLYQLLVDRCVAVLVSDGQGGRWQPLAPGAIAAEGFRADQALLPADTRVFQGYRLLHEYFAFPARFHFCSIGGLRRAAASLQGDEFEMAILLDRNLDALAASIDHSSFVLNCTPAVNLFPYHAGRVMLSLGEFEHHIVPDRTRPLDFEIYRVDAVQGFDRGNMPLTSFRPFYQSLDSDARPDGAYYSVRRENRRLSETAERNGKRSGYLGSEVFLSLVDGAESPWHESIEQLSIALLATNRDLPALMPVSGHHDFTIDSSSQLAFANILRGPTKPRPSIAERELTWRLISHLSLNYLALKDLDETNGAVAIRELLGLYGALADPLVARHGESIESSLVRPVTRRLPGDGPLVYGRGVNIALTVDDSAFAGHSPFLFGSVLEQYFSRHVSINLFTELTLIGKQSGQIAYWGPRWGGRPDA